MIRGVPRAAAGWGIALILSAGCQPEKTPRSDPGTDGGLADDAATWLVDVTERVGLEFVHDSGAAGEFLLTEIMGSGVALFDCEGDGDLDVYLTNGGDPLAGGSRPDVGNRFFRQEPGPRFVDRTRESGLGDPGYGMGIAVGDYDNDGSPDVYVTNFGADRLYRNRGDGSFEDVTAAAGIEADGWSCSATFFDYDLDGHLDLFVTRYVEYDPAKGCTDSSGRVDYCRPQAFPPAPDLLLRNRGDGTFADVSVRAGLHGAIAPGLGVVVEDFNGDGRPDVYVANDGEANHLWVNQGDGTFLDDALTLGVAYNLEGMPEASMGVLVADLDGDLDLDIFLSHLAGETNTFYRNRGGSRGFDDATGVSELGTQSVTHTGFGVVAFDVDLDGDLDLAVVNGRVTRGKSKNDGTVRPPWDQFVEPNRFYVNAGEGRFQPIGEVATSFTRPLEVSRGLAAGDIDRDGDVDLVVSNIEGRARVYFNEASRQGGWITVRAIDPRHGRDAIGARVVLTLGDRQVLRTISRGYSYLSSSEPRARFAIPQGVEAKSLEVHWPGGPAEQFDLRGQDKEVVVFRGRGN